MKEPIGFEDFMKVDIRVGEVLEAKVYQEARKPAYILVVDFGEEIGTKKCSAQITECYDCEELVGKQVLGVVNFPPKQIGKLLSEALVLGVYSDQGVVLIRPDQKVKKGDRLG
ncbi:tRNA-binding protein [Isachenkonia alkalipeptolytica]|uniref:tRNA-binding protein n=1 Tax=Isachenkonia alkalipeptolytica TaxID=2565777 RepID=A0AA44BC21_9CLOT|nr:tRNA-binding protein [Isachenkonia alkalipeptolytica]NBG86909.1 tRNA-binding protein [Isachenkonia alkalipeptolytica]